MSNLRILRHRMKSISSIAKVTSAMKMISTVTMRRAQQKFEAAAQYQKPLGETLQVLCQHVEEKPLLLQEARSDEKTAIVGIFSDKGLCGAYNQLVASRVEHLMHHKTNPYLYLLGNKGISLLHKYAGHIQEQHLLKTIQSYAAIKSLGEKLVQDFYAGTINSCIVVYTEFKSILSTRPTEEVLFPITISPSFDAPMLYGTDPQGLETLRATAEQYVVAKLYYLVQQSIVSENAVRMFSMDSATKNANDILNTLHKAYHKTRQQNITQEIMEIIGGSEAL